MFYSLTGEIVYSENNFVALNCNGVAFKVNTSATTMKKIGGTSENTTLFTYMSVREDAIEIFGFSDKSELELFKLLISISGVGPKAAVAILSVFDSNSLSSAIARGDSKSITKAQGVGPKLAQRIVLELKDKIKSFYYESNNSTEDEIISDEVPGDNLSEAISALIVLGYTKNDAIRAFNGVDGKQPVDNLIKIGLNNISRRM